ncbi:hypothetical protein C8R46DRAFT_1030644 [Mycena filopes]|nr:hypothetical protein C8R46DRAFT_1030644 [Mycena filopes]
MTRARHPAHPRYPQAPDALGVHEEHTLESRTTGNFFFVNVLADVLRVICPIAEIAGAIVDNGVVLRGQNIPIDELEVRVLRQQQELLPTQSYPFGESCAFALIPPHPSLEILKKGLSALKNSVKERRTKLLARLKKEEKLSPADKAWLDNDGNQVNEDAVIQKLENASDYERGLSCLNSNEAGLVEKLKGLAGEVGQKVSEAVKNNKRKTHRNSRLASRAVKAEPEQDRQTLQYHLSEPLPEAALISSWLKDEKMWRECWAEAEQQGRAVNAKRVKQVEHLEVDKMLVLWIAKAMHGRVHLSSEILRAKCTLFADLVGIPEEDRLVLSDGWLAALKKRCGLKEFKRHGEADSANLADIEADRKRIQDLIFHEGYALRDIFNMDETGLFWA